MNQETTMDELYPEITEVNRKFYDSIEKGELVANHCQDCNHTYLPSATNCPNCLSNQIEWIPLSGEGTVYSWVEYHRAYHDAFKSKIPYVVAIVQLKEGPRLISNIVDYDVETLKVGTALEAVFTKGPGDFPIVQFRPINN